MNTPNIIPPHSDITAELSAATAATSAFCKSTPARLERCVQQHPGVTLLAAAGLGIIATLVVRALSPAPPRHRAAQLLEDIQERLSEIAEGGAKSLGQGVDHISDLHLERKLGRLSHGIKNLFHA
jgi:hypothetical protein